MSNEWWLCPVRHCYAALIPDSFMKRTIAMSTLTTHDRIITPLGKALRAMGRIIWHPGTTAVSFHTVPHWIDFLNDDPSRRRD